MLLQKKTAKKEIARLVEHPNRTLRHAAIVLAILVNELQLYKGDVIYLSQKIVLRNNQVV